MKSYFSKIFYPVLLILLVSLLVIGIALHMLVQGVLKERSLKELETTANSIGELAHAYIADGNFYNEDFCDYVRLQELQDQLAELEAQLEHKEERWMYLTELKEKIDAQGK